jgi:hypothetical protein
MLEIEPNSQEQAVIKRYMCGKRPENAAAIGAIMIPFR